MTSPADLTRRQREVAQQLSPSVNPADVAADSYLAELRSMPELAGVVRPASAGVSPSVVSRQGGKSLTTLIRGAARQEALRFMPSLRLMLDDPKVGWKLKLQAFETLLKYGIGVKDPSGDMLKTALKAGGVLILPPQATESTPAPASEEAVVVTPAVASPYGALALPPLDASGGV